MGKHTGRAIDTPTIVPMLQIVGPYRGRGACGPRLSVETYRGACVYMGAIPDIMRPVSFHKNGIGNAGHFPPLHRHGGRGLFPDKPPAGHVPARHGSGLIDPRRALADMRRLPRIGHVYTLAVYTPLGMM